MRPVVLRDGRPREIEPLSDGGVVDFGEPIGEGRTIYTLHSELQHVRRELRLSRGELSSLPVARPARRASGSGRRARRPMFSADPPRRSRPRDGRSRCTSSRRWPESDGLAFGPSPSRSKRGASAAGSSRPRLRSPPRSDCWLAERSTPGAPFPRSAASTRRTMFAELERRGCRFEVTTPEEVRA